MVEPISSAVVGGYLVKKVSDGLGRLLGPSADEAAGVLACLTAKKLSNVGLVVERANAKTTAGASDGRIAERTALRILDEAGYTDDEVVVEYLSGVMASSKSWDGQDDRGSALTLTISRLSSLALRMHYVLYVEALRRLEGSSLDIWDINAVQTQGQIFVPWRTLVPALGLTGEEANSGIVIDTTYALEREQLVKFWGSGVPDYMRAQWNVSAPEGGFLFNITPAGAELFLWALGQGQTRTREFSSVDVGQFVMEDLDFDLEAELVTSMAGTGSAWRRADPRP